MPFFVVLKGGVSLKFARFLSKFCPYRGANTTKSGIVNYAQHYAQGYAQQDFLPI